MTTDASLVSMSVLKFNQDLGIMANGQYSANQATFDAYVADTVFGNISAVNAQIQNSIVEDVQAYLIETSQAVILNDIYNVLYDIKKLLIESQNNFKEKNKKVKKYVDCCLCGSQPKISKTAEGSIELKCTGCKNSEQDATEQLVKLKWNKVNKQL